MTNPTTDETLAALSARERLASYHSEHLPLGERRWQATHAMLRFAAAYDRVEEHGRSARDMAIAFQLSE